MLKLTLLSTIILVMATITAQAEPPKNKDMIEWEGKGKVFQDLYLNDPDGCNKVFNALWPDAKKGDLNARFYLLLQMATMHGPSMDIPSPSTDIETRQRQYLIMAAHSIGTTLTDEHSPLNNYNTEMAIAFIRDLGGNSDFKECLQKSPSPECVKLGIKNEDIPSFDNFAKEIDLFINAGYKAKCLGNDHWKEQDRLSKENMK